MSRSIHLAIASTTSKPGDVDGNLEQIVGFARQAAVDGAHLLLTPEMSASGYGNYPMVLETAEVAGDGPIYRALATAAAQTGVVLCAGFVEKAEQKAHLAHYIVFPDGRFVVQRKNRIMESEKPLDPAVPFVAAMDEMERPGYSSCRPQIETFEVEGIRCAVLICADSGILNLHEMLTELGVQVMLGPAGAGGKREDRVTSAELRTPAGRATYQRVVETVFFPGGNIITDCLKHRRTVASVNLCGHDGAEHYHTGHGTIVTPMGEVPALFHGLPNLDRQRPMYAHARVDVDDVL